MYVPVINMHCVEIFTEMQGSHIMYVFTCFDMKSK